MTISIIRVPFFRLLGFILPAMLFLLITDQSAVVLAEGLAASPRIEITFRDQLISADLVDAPLIDVLQRIQQEFGFKAHFHGDLTEAITLSFTDLPLLKSLQQLTVNQSLSVATRTTRLTPEQNEAKQIAEIWVLSRSATAPSPGSMATAPVMPGPADSDVAVDAVEDSFGQDFDAQAEKIPSDQPLKSENKEESSKQQTIKNLAVIGDPASVMAIAEFTHDVDQEIRQLSVRAIGSVDSVESTHLLGQVLSDEPDAEIRKIAVRALGERQHEATAKTFLERALNDADPGVKTLASQLLAQ